MIPHSAQSAPHGARSAVVELTINRGGASVSTTTPPPVVDPYKTCSTPDTLSVSIEQSELRVTGSRHPPVATTRSGIFATIALDSPLHQTRLGVPPVRLIESSPATGEE